MHHIPKTRTFDFSKSNFWLGSPFFCIGRLTLSANREAQKSGLERYKRIWALLPRPPQSVPGILMRRPERCVEESGAVSGGGFWS